MKHLQSLNSLEILLFNPHINSMSNYLHFTDVDSEAHLSSVTCSPNQLMGNLKFYIVICDSKASAFFHWSAVLHSGSGGRQGTRVPVFDVE